MSGVSNQWVFTLKNPWTLHLVRKRSDSKKFHHEAFDVGVLFLDLGLGLRFCRVQVRYKSEP